MRLFLGFEPAAREREIYSLCDRLEFQSDVPLRWVPSENWHVTLVFLGELPERSLERIATTVAPLVEAQAPLRVMVEGLDWFPSALKPRLLALHLASVEALLSLQSGVAGALRREGFHSERRPYRPHLTLARLKGSRKQFEPPPLLPIIPFELELAELVLFESHKKERRYVPLHRFSLMGATAAL